MKNKVVAILALSAAALGSAIFTAPANAVSQDVNVEITVSPVLYLRTFETVSLQVTNKDLGSSDRDMNTVKITDGTTKIDRTTPDSLSALQGGTVSKQVDELYAVWSNSKNGVTVKVTPVDGKTTLTNQQDTTKKATLTTAQALVESVAGPMTLSKPSVGGAKLDFDLLNPAPGKYTGGMVRVEATPNF